MALIEGIGDEVTILFVLLLIFIIVCLAWVSTSVSDRTAIRIVILDRARFQQFLRRFMNRGAPPIENVQNSDNEVSLSVNSSENNHTQNGVESNVDVPGSTRDNLFGKSPGQQHPPVVQPETHTETPNVTSDALVQETEVPQAVLDSFLSSTQTPVSHHEHVESQLRPPSSSNDKLHTEQPEDRELDGREQQTCNTDDSVTDIQECPVTSSTSDAAREDAPNTSGTTEPSGGTGEDQVIDGHIRIRLKYLDERQKLVQAHPEDTIGQFKRKHFSVELADNFTVRFIYRGVELREDRSTLQANRVEDNSVIHCLMSRISQSEQPTPQQENIDFGFLMFPLFAVILCLLWYCRFTYRSYFSAVSTLSLMGISFLFLVGVLAFFRRGVHEHED